MTKKETTDLDKPVTKREMINYIGPIFQDLRQEFRQELGSKFSSLSAAIHEMKILWETDPRLNAFSDLVKLMGQNNLKTEDHTKRLTCLEKDVQILKLDKNR